MNLLLSQKAQAMLEEAKASEQLCVHKYAQASQNAHCPQLSQLFSNIAQQEENHLNELTQMLGGQLPQFKPHVSAAQGIANQQQPTSRYATSQSLMENAMSQTSGQYNAEDKELLEDLLKDEKYMSNLYSEAIFEQTDGQARQLLNTIQGQEQEHGKMLFDYMNSHGMYAVQPANDQMMN